MKLGPQYQQLRLYDLLITTYIGRIINVSVGGVVDRPRQSRNIKLFANNERVYFTAHVINYRQTAGLRMMYLIKLYGWAVLLSEIISTGTMRNRIRGDLSTLEVYDHWKRCIDRVITSENAKLLIINIVKRITNENYAMELVRRIDNGIQLLK